MERDTSTFWLVRPGERPHVVREASAPEISSAIVDARTLLLIRGYVEDCKTGERFAVRKGIDFVVSVPPVLSKPKGPSPSVGGRKAGSSG